MCSLLLEKVKVVQRETPFAIKQCTEAEAKALPVMNFDVKPPVTRTSADGGRRDVFLFLCGTARNVRF